jgi:DNA replication protein DnaC
MSAEIVDSECFRHGAYKGPIGRYGSHPECPTCVKEREAQTRQQWVNESGLRGRFLEATFATYEVTHGARQASVVADCLSFVEGLSPNTWGAPWLIGPPGTGKTHLGAAMAIAAIRERGARAIVVTAREVVRRLRATWRRDASETEDLVIDELGRVPLLVLDEVGAGFGSDSEATQLLDVIDRRYQYERPVVLISNFDVNGVQAALGERAFDRLREGASILACDWESYRREAMR